jgi:apolipoprotein N-acyltransferase
MSAQNGSDMKDADHALEIARMVYQNELAEKKAASQKNKTGDLPPLSSTTKMGSERATLSEPNRPKDKMKSALNISTLDEYGKAGSTKTSSGISSLSSNSPNYAPEKSYSAAWRSSAAVADQVLNSPPESEGFEVKTKSYSENCGSPFDAPPPVVSEQPSDSFSSADEDSKSGRSPPRKNASDADVTTTSPEVRPATMTRQKSSAARPPTSPMPVDPNALAPIMPPSSNVDPLAAKTILQSLKRNISLSRSRNIVPTLNMLDKQMAMAGITASSRAALFTSLLDEESQQQIMSAKKGNLSQNWEAMREYVVSAQNNRRIEGDRLADFLNVARSVTRGNASSCVIAAIENWKLITPYLLPKVAFSTFIASIPDERVRMEFNELYELALSSRNNDGSDEYYMESLQTAAKMLDKRASPRVKPFVTDNRSHSRNNSSNDFSNRRLSSMSSRSESMNSRSSAGSKKSTLTSTRVVDRLHNKEVTITRERSKGLYTIPSASIVDGNEDDDKSSVRSSGNAANKTKYLVTVYNYPENKPLDPLCDMMTPKNGRAPVMIRNESGVVKVLFTDKTVANGVAALVNGYVMSNHQLEAKVEPRYPDRLQKSPSSVYSEKARLSRAGSVRSVQTIDRKATMMDQRKLPSFVRETTVTPVVEEEKEEKMKRWHDLSLNDMTTVGLGCLVLAAICSGLGNALNTVSPLAWAHPFFLLLGFDYCNRGQEHSFVGHVFSIGVIIITQSLGGLLGFAKFFAYSTETPITASFALLYSVVMWTVLSVVAVLLEYAFRYRFHGSYWTPIVFPSAHTFVTCVVFGTRLGTFPALGNAVIDFSPLRQLAAVIGIGGINFIAVLLPTIAFLKVVKYKYKRYVLDIPIMKYTNAFYFVMLFFIFVAMGFVIQADMLYQTGSPINPNIDVSCISGSVLQKTGAHEGWDAVLNSTATALKGGSKIVLWADKTLYTSDDVTETQMIKECKQFVKQYGRNQSYLGIAYQKFIGQKTRKNIFILIGPGGEEVINAEPAYPIPLLDFGVRSSASSSLQIYDTKEYGKLGVVVGYDMTIPSFVREAGDKHVNILLHSAWSHGAVASRSFETDAIRSIENGVTTFRCTVNGFSGIVDYRGNILAKSRVGSDPGEVVHFQLPLLKHIHTVYTVIGFIFDYFCAVVTGLCLFWVIAPRCLLDAACGVKHKDDATENPESGPNKLFGDVEDDRSSVYSGTHNDRGMMNKDGLEMESLEEADDNGELSVLKESDGFQV